MENYFGEIRLFAGDYAPDGWLLCDGRVLRISEYEILFSLIGTLWGGDGNQTFKLPDLRGRVVIGSGTGVGLAPRSIGEAGGEETVRLYAHAMPGHTHALKVSQGPATTNVPTNAVFAATRSPTAPTGREGLAYCKQVNDDRTLAAETITSVGGDQPHFNVMPSLALNYIIATSGTYPSE
ncbi:phage tail protein [Ancylobacter rudongensis]|uniref:Microcystin-dependent protein n=1 Tax=Ancylobacter rudongensis TaxID=177413 RepID=A0A1G4QLR7_9HYPH|nr:tail fiber protein [Ancylobacter rudongensis]SCW45351.1 Microcystin-dependent protein [Ancylobacter rudongensis]